MPKIIFVNAVYLEAFDEEILPCLGENGEGVVLVFFLMMFQFF